MAGDFSISAPIAATPAVFSTNGAAHTSPGQRPGYASSFNQALKGRPNRCLAPSGLGMFLTIEPRALPWAGISRPFGATEEGGQARAGYGQALLTTLTEAPQQQELAS
jgi:hypothetical protein